MKVFIIGSVKQDKMLQRVYGHWITKHPDWDIERVKREPGVPIDRLILNALDKIKSADIIAVLVKPDGSFGTGTLYEMAYAKMLNKTIMTHNPYTLINKKCCFNCMHEKDIDHDNPNAYPYYCNTCRYVSETDKTPTNWMSIEEECPCPVKIS